MSATSVFTNVELAPRDPILGLTEAYNADQRSGKVNLGTGVYSDENGQLPLLKVVQAAEEQRLLNAPARGYQPIDGPAAYKDATCKLVFGSESSAVAEGKVVTVQSLGGTGALRVGADYLRRLLPDSKVYLSEPSWENHRALFEAANFEVSNYAYYDPHTRGVDVRAMRADLAALPKHSVVVLHACCHNPTGADLSQQAWETVIALCGERELVPFLDMAYQGFADGLETDAAVVRRFAESGLSFLVAASFSKNLSLYGERVGSLSVVTGSKDEAARVLSQLKRVIRTNYSNPPTHGGVLTTTILSDPDLHALWETELAEMRERIHKMREMLSDALLNEGSPRDFSFIRTQRGMFSYTGLTADEVELLQKDYGIYAVATGRICVAALNTNNVATVAKAIASVLRQS